MINETSAPTPSSAADRCADCQARLSHDQRYCVECGTRRGPLPAQIAGVIGALREQGPAPALAPETPRSVLDPANAPRGPQFAMPGPRAAAVAVMGMLGFGVIVGSLAGGASVATLASAPLIVVGLGHTTPRTPTLVSAARSNPAASSGAAGAAAAAPPAATQQASASPSTSPTPAASGTNTGASTGTVPATGFGGLPPVKHVFLIVLSDRRLTKSFDGAARAGRAS